MNHAEPRPSIPARNLPAGEIRPNLEQLEALGPGNRAPARRETAFRSAISTCSRRPSALDPRAAHRQPPAAERNPAHGDRISSSSRHYPPSIDHQLDERRPFVCQIGMQTPPAAARAAGRDPRAGIRQQLAGARVDRVTPARQQLARQRPPSAAPTPHCVS